MERYNILYETELYAENVMDAALRFSNDSYINDLIIVKKNDDDQLYSVDLIHDDNDQIIEIDEYIPLINNSVGNLKLDIDSESVTIYIDNGDDKENIPVCYWHIDEIEEDAEVAFSMANAIRLYYTDQQKLIELLKPYNNNYLV